MSSMVCPWAMLRRRVTIHSVNPLSTISRNGLSIIFRPNPSGTSLPGPPGSKRNVLGPLPHFAKAIELGKTPLTGPWMLVTPRG